MFYIIIIYIFLKEKQLIHKTGKKIIIKYKHYYVFKIFVLKHPIAILHRNSWKVQISIKF